MKNKQTLGDIKNSDLHDVNTNTQQEDFNTQVEGDININSVNEKVDLLFQKIETSDGNIEKLSTEIKKWVNNAEMAINGKLISLKSDMEDIKFLAKKKTSTSGLKLLGTISSIAVIFFGLAIVANKKLDFGLSDNAIVIAFVGIIATFVVVGNYMQVKDIQREFDRKIKDIQDEYDKKNIKMQEEYDNLRDFNSIDISNIFATLKLIYNPEKDESWCLFSMLSLSNSSYFKKKIDCNMIQGALANLIPKIEKTNFSKDHINVMKFCIEKFKRNEFYFNELDDIERILNSKTPPTTT